MRDVLNTTDSGAALRMSNSFVRDVIRQYTDDGWMTEAQYNAVRRLMVDAGFRLLANISPGNMEWVTPSESEVATATTGEPADCNGAVDIPNGNFNVNLADEETWQFRITTIRQARNEDLINKRVVAFRDGTEWTNFAFLTTTNRLKVWRRFEAHAENADDDMSQIVLYAKQLLNILRQHRLQEHYHASTFEHADPVNPESLWTVVLVDIACRYCNTSIEESQPDTARGHDACGRWRRYSGEYRETPRFIPDATGPIRIHTIQEPDSYMGPATRRTVSAAAASREVHTYSELGTGWEQ